MLVSFLSLPATNEFQVNAVPTPVVEWRWQGQRIRNGSLANVGEALFLIREEATEVVDGGLAPAASTVGQRTSNLTVVRADLEHGGEYVCVGKNSAGEQVLDFCPLFRHRDGLKGGPQVL